MIPEELIKKLQDEAKRYPHGWPPRTEKEESHFIAGGQFGYGLAQEEIERLKTLLKDEYFKRLSHLNHSDIALNNLWQQFKEQNKL